MSNMVKIEALRDNGQWYQMAVVVNSPPTIKRHLEIAANSPVAKNTKKSRATDIKTGSVLDILQI
jgi:hypothetical protein